MSLSRAVDAVYEQVWADYGRPRHPEDVQGLRDMIADIGSRVVAYLDEHPERVDWHDPEDRR